MSDLHSSSVDSAFLPTVLVADDDHQVRSALRTRLESWGYRVIEAHDGLSAVVKTIGSHADVIVLDHQMPLGDGRSIAENLRQDTDAPIIFLSGHQSEEFRDTIMRIANSYYLSKPLDSEKLWALLTSLCQPLAVA